MFCIETSRYAHKVLVFSSFLVVVLVSREVVDGNVVLVEDVVVVDSRRGDVEVRPSEKLVDSSWINN
jgi:hypothetical protein